jgi:chromosome segregation ATPase
MKNWNSVCPADAVRRSALIVLLLAMWAAPARAAEDPAVRAEKELRALKDEMEARLRERKDAEDRVGTAEKIARQAESTRKASDEETARIRTQFDRVNRDYLELADRSVRDTATLAELKTKIRAMEGDLQSAREARDRLQEKLTRAQDELLNIAEGSASSGAEVAMLRRTLTGTKADLQARDDENLELKRVIGGLKNRLAQAGVDPKEIARAEENVRIATKDLRDELETTEDARQELIRRWQDERTRMQKTFEQERQSWRLVQKGLEEQIGLMEKELQRLGKH